MTTRRCRLLILAVAAPGSTWRGKRNSRTAVPMCMTRSSCSANSKSTASRKEVPLWELSRAFHTASPNDTVADRVESASLASTCQLRPSMQVRATVPSGAAPPAPALAGAVPSGSLGFGPGSLPRWALAAASSKSSFSSCLSLSCWEGPSSLRYSPSPWSSRSRMIRSLPVPVLSALSALPAASAAPASSSARLGHPAATSGSGRMPVMRSNSASTSAGQVGSAHWAGGCAPDGGPPARASS
mmetsp:Transcript_38511/g.108926  ORF Transcript_38511/g.108926 Transcript_38511/m.108926 type:complete len:242 (-) Transcript_38511:501-1226(-)